jgi:hypothetical protein
MPIRTSCPSCSKAYNVPDHLAGKSIKCRDCGKVFSIARADDGLPDLSKITLDDAEAPASPTGAMHRVAKADAPVSAYDLKNTAVARRMARFTFAGAKVLDQVLAPLLIALALVVTAAVALGSSQGEGVINLGRLLSLLFAFFACVWSFIHIATVSAARSGGFGTPPGLILRTLGAASPVLMFGTMLWYAGDGSITTLVVGLLIGFAGCVGASWFLVRLMPQDISPTAVRQFIGLLAGTAIAAAVLFVLNVVAMAVVPKMADLSASPIALRMPWVEKQTEEASANGAGAAPTVADGRATDLTRVERVVSETVLGAGDLLLNSPSDPSSFVVVRAVDANPSIEVWQTDPWERPAEPIAFARRFEPREFVVNSDASIFARLTRFPRLSVDLVPLDGGPSTGSVALPDTTGDRTIVGFVTPTLLVNRIDTGSGTALELVPTNEAGMRPVANPILAGPGRNLLLSKQGQNLAFVGQDRIVAVGRDTRERKAWLVVSRLGAGGTPDAREVAVDSQFELAPVALVPSPSGTRVAMLIEGAGDLVLTVWQVAEIQREGLTLAPPRTPIAEVNLGPHLSLKPATWRLGSPLIWRDENSLLLYGSAILDATTGRSTGRTNAQNVLGQIRTASGELRLLTGSPDNARLRPIDALN